jgi:predicted RNA-binding Zn-ribbon protein involved in translation (DUF1610 family)
MAKVYHNFDEGFSKFKLTKKVKGKVKKKTPEEIARYFYNQGKQSKQIDMDIAIQNKQYEISKILNTPKEYAFTYQCDHCEHEIENWTLDLTDDDGIKIPVYNLSQTSFECPNCGAEFGTGDIDVVEYRGPDSEGSEDDEGDTFLANPFDGEEDEEEEF